jgi:hypothetical protein
MGGGLATLWGGERALLACALAGAVALGAIVVRAPEARS